VEGGLRGGHTLVVDIVRLHDHEKALVFGDVMRTVAHAVGEGRRAGGSGVGPTVVVRCHKCNEENPPDARCCNNCAAALVKTKACSQCGERNDPDAEYREACGHRLG